MENSLILQSYREPTSKAMSIKNSEDISIPEDMGEGENEESEQSMSTNIPYYNTTETSK
jgi:hypothetical protein